MIYKNLIKHKNKSKNGKGYNQFFLDYQELIRISKGRVVLLEKNFVQAGDEKIVNDYFKIISHFDIFQNNNHAMNLKLATSLVKNFTNELVEFVPFLKEFALEKIVVYANMGERNIDEMIKYQKKLEEENNNKNGELKERISKIITRKIEDLEYLKNEWVTITEKIGNYCDSSAAAHFVLTPVFLVGLFENSLTYLFDYRTQSINMPRIQKEAPEKLKELIKNNLLKESKFIDFVKESKGVINREIYTNNINNLEVFDLLKHYEGIPSIYNSIISSKEFVKKEFDCFSDLIRDVKDTNILNRIYTNIEKIKNPKKGTKLLKKEIEKTLDSLKSKIDFEDDLFFDDTVVEEKFQIKLKLINNPFLNKDSALYFSYFLDSIRKEDSEYLGINKISSEINSRKGILNINIFVKKENRGEKYYKELIKKMFQLKSNWTDVFTFDKAQMIATLKEFHLMYIIEKNTTNRPKTSEMKKKI